MTYLVYCKICNEFKDYVEQPIKKTQMVKETSEILSYVGVHAVCKDCGTELDVEEVSFADKRAFCEAYRSLRDGKTP